MQTDTKSFENLHTLRRELDLSSSSARERKFLSPAFYGQFLRVEDAFIRFLNGSVLDLGCGVMPYRELVPDRVTRYDGLDIAPMGGTVALIGDIQDLSMIRGNSYDSVVCLEVLEHVPEPNEAVAEIARILRHDGILILSVPHLSRLHEIPYDYYRYTEYGLRHLLEKHNLMVVELHDRGGLLTFLGHQVATIIIALFWRHPRLWEIARWVNRWLITLPAYNLDQIGPQRKLFPTGYLVVARKTT